MPDTHSMIERVATILLNASGYHPQAYEAMHPQYSGAPPIPPAWKQYEAMARKIVGAMREPTEAMKPSDGVSAGVANGSDHYLDRDEARHAWQAMIDAALEDGR